MKEVGNKIKEFRKKKGLSQEDLAELAKVNLRTIQRIETNVNDPSGKTLNLLCDALNISIEDIVDYGKTEDKTFLILFHLSVLSFLVLPLGNIIIPVILWLTKKDKIIGLKNVGANLINYQICWSIITYLSIILGFIGKLFRVPFLDNLNFANFLYLLIILYLINIILPIVFAIRIVKGKINNRYPKLFNIIS